MLPNTRRIFRWFAPWPRFCGLLTMLFLARAAFVLSILPPFEGWDEYQHLAYIAFLAENGRPPALADGSKVPRSLYHELVRYPHCRLASEQLEPIGARSYETFWNARTPAEVPPNAPALRLYQAQHPPLYYRLVRPLYERLAGEDGVLRAVTGLRWVNVLLGVAALLVVLFGVGVSVPAGPSRYLVGVLIALQPVFLLNCTRVANDALAVLLGTVAIAAVLVVRPQRSWTGLTIAGITLGLAILAKASCLSLLPFAVILAALRVPAFTSGTETSPLSGNAAGWDSPGAAEDSRCGRGWFARWRTGCSTLALRGRRRTGSDGATSTAAEGVSLARAQAGVLHSDGYGNRLLGCVLLLGIVAVITCPYFHENLSRYGVLTPMQEAVENHEAGKTPADAIRAAKDIDWWSDFVSRQLRYGFWVSGWSFARAPKPLRFAHETAVYLALIGGLVALCYRHRGQRRLFTEPAVAPCLVLLLVCTAAGLAYHAVQTKMAHGAVGTNPWYAAMVFPWLLCLGYQGYVWLPGRWTAPLLGWALTALYLAAEIYGTLAIMVPVYAQAPWGPLARERLGQLHLAGLGPGVALPALGCVLFMVVIAVGVWTAAVKNAARNGGARHAQSESG